MNKEKNFEISFAEVVKRFKKCEVVKYYDGEFVATQDYLKDAVLDIIDKQEKEIDKLKDCILEQGSITKKQYEVIDKMAKDIYDDEDYRYIKTDTGETVMYSSMPSEEKIEWIKKYFFKEVEDE